MPKKSQVLTLTSLTERAATPQEDAVIANSLDELLAAIARELFEEPVVESGQADPAPIPIDNVEN